MSDTLLLAKQLLADAANQEINEIPDDAELGRWSGWDSLSHLRLILSIEERLGHEIEPELMVEISTLGDIAKQL